MSFRSRKGKKRKKEKIHIDSGVLRVGKRTKASRQQQSVSWKAVLFTMNTGVVSGRERREERG